MFELTPFSRMADFYSPFRELAEMERKMNSTMGAFTADIRDNGDAYVMEADLPGVKKEDICIDIDGDCLSINAQRSARSEEREGNYIRCERMSGSFSRSFDISGIRSQDITASYDNGVLTLTMPKKDASVPTARRLEIQ